MKKFINFVLTAVLVSTLLPAFAELVPTFNYQGRLSNPDGTPYTSTASVSVTLSIYDVETGGVSLMNKVYSCSLQNGYFNIQFGDTESMNLSSLSYDKQYYLGVKVEGFEEITPREKLGHVAYAMRAKSAETIDDNTITTNKISDSAVTSSKIAYHAITAEKLDNGVILNAKLADDSISTDKIFDGTIQHDDISIVSGNRIVTSNIETNAIDSRTLADGAVSSQSKAPWAPTVNNGVSNPKILTGYGTTPESGLYTVTFSSAFESNPVVVATVNSGNEAHRLTISTLTTTGFIIRTYSRWSEELSGPISFEWIAIGH